MQGGFSFCGMNIANLGIFYAPELNDTFVYGNSSANFEEEIFTARDGGVYYGTSRKPKEFRLRCFFEDKHINNSIIDNIMNFFYIGRTGKLIFDTRDWCWYNATVQDVSTDPTNFLNGFITITLKAYYPYARTDIYTCVLNEDSEYFSYIDVKSDEVIPEWESSISFYGDAYDELVNTNYTADSFLDIKGNLIYTTDQFILNRTRILDNEHMPISAFTNVTSSKTLLLYNAGNMPASVAIRIQGECGPNGIKIQNKQTMQTASFKGFTRQLTTNAGFYILADSINGKTVLTNGEESRPIFLCHDYGFIDLVPSTIYRKDVIFQYENGTNTVYTESALTEECIGYYIYLDRNWHKIISLQDSHHITIDKALTEDDAQYSDIVLMNELGIFIDDNKTQLDSIQFLYRHTFR